MSNQPHDQVDADRNIPPGYDPGLYRIRHSLAHVMAQAVLELYPEAKIGIGPPTAEGFYYDFDLGSDERGTRRAFGPEDLGKIEERMRQIVAGWHAFRRQAVSHAEALQLFRDQPYKLELIAQLMSGRFDEYGSETEGPVELSTYTHDTFLDLCRGPHVPNTGAIPADAFTLLHVAGAYWRGNEANPMLQRIYGTAWRNREDLARYLENLEEARKRDHRKLGRELEIFTLDDEVGPGLPLWLPRGEIILSELETLAEDREARAGYQRVRTPHIGKEELFLHSGHLPYYAESMFPAMEREGKRYYLKPMNCPFHHKIFASKPRSYRDLPLRLAEHGTCYRYEQSGELFGVLRARMLQQNDAHIYCAEEQFEDEFLAVIGLYLEYFRLFGIEKYVMRLSTHDRRGLGKKYVDDERLWIRTEEMVRKAMANGNVDFIEVKDEAAFYGPKIDVQIWSAIGREFTLATNQVDFSVPARFGLTFTNREGAEETPLCIHRAPLGSHERMVGFLIEHYAGNFPVWLAPEQVRIVPVTAAQNEYARKVCEMLRERSIRGDADLGSERMNAKIRAAQLMKVPYVLVVGNREVGENTVSLRKRDGARADNMALPSFLGFVEERVRSRSGEL